MSPVEVITLLLTGFMLLIAAGTLVFACRDTVNFVLPGTFDVPKMPAKSAQPSTKEVLFMKGLEIGIDYLEKKK